MSTAPFQKGVNKAGRYSLSWEEKRGVGSVSIICRIGAFSLL